MNNENTTSADRYKALFLSSRDAVMTLEPPSWKFTSGNPATVAMFGAKNEEDFLRYPPWELSPKLQPDGMNSMGKAKEMIDQAIEKGSNFFEWNHMRVDGKEFPAEVLLSRVDQGGKTYLQAVVRDITERKKLEQQIREAATEQFRVIFDNTNDGVLITDTKSKKFLIGNKAIQQMLGYNEQELSTLTIADIHPKESIASVLEQFEKQTRGELRIAKGLPVKRKDGSIFYADVNTSNITINGANCNLGVFRDVSENRKKEVEREQYFNFFQLSTDIMVIADPQGCFKKVNPACLSVLGYTEDELLSKPFIDFVHPEDKQATADEMVKQMRVGSSLDFENRYMRKDGSILLLSWRANYDKKEGITYATARDITERASRELALKSRLDEIEKLNKFMVGRELKMADLKKKIDELKRKQQ